ncbi:MAG: sulfotransferase [Methylomonas sp.]
MFTQAEKIFRELVRLRKNSEIALAGLGQCQCQLNRRSEGVGFLHQAGKLLLKKTKRTGQARDLCDLTYQLIHWHALDEALELAKAAVSMNPALPQAHHLAAIALQGLNRLPEALLHALKAVELMPGESNAQILLAVLEAKTGNLGDASQRLQGVIDLENDPNAGRAHLELGNILDKRGEFDRAFRHLTTAGRILSDTLAARRIDKSAVFNDLNQLKAGFDTQFLQTSRERVDEDGLPSPVFLIGFYRSGSTLAEQILSAHPQVMSSGEEHLIGHVLSELSSVSPGGGSLPDRIKALNPLQIAHLRKHYWIVARQLLGEKVMHQVLVDKTTLNTLNIELINTLFPDAQVIFCIRDPRDVCLSSIMQSFMPSPLTIHLLDWRDCARFYAAVMDYWLSVRDVLSLYWTELRYEDVVIDLEGQFRPILEKMGLEWSPACLEFYRHARTQTINTPSYHQVTRPLYTASVGRWRDYQSHYAPILPLLEPYIERFGY